MNLTAPGRFESECRKARCQDCEFWMQRTSNFDWTDAGWLTNRVGVTELDIPLPPGASNEFFRVIGP